MNLRGYHAFIGPHSYLADSDGRIQDDRPYLDWLLENWETETKVTYDLDSFAACLFKLIQMTREEAVSLIEREKINIEGYDITYFPGRYLSIGKGKSYNRPYAAFYDMSRYIEQVIHSENGIIEKARLARDMALKIHDGLKEIGNGVDYTAVGSITKALKPVMAKITPPPTHLDCPAEVIKLALDNVKGNWVEAYKIGYIPQCYDLDMSGAYASFLANLPDIRRGKWVASQTIPDAALLGFARCDYTCRSLISPVIFRNGDSLYRPLGRWDDVLNLDEIRHIEKWGADDYAIRSGWWWIPEGELKYPYRGLVNWLWQKRQQSAGMTKDIIKRTMAYLWGQTLADYGTDFGELYNPVYGALVESRCRIKVADFVLSRGLEKNLCHVAVDGALFDCPVELEEKGGIGDWRVSYKSQAIIVNSGFVFIEGKAGLQEFAHSFEWLKPQLDADPDLTCYKREKWTVCSLSQAVLQNKFDQLGQLQKVSEDIDIGRETKRFYLKMPQTGRELLSGTFNSQPLSVDVVRMLKNNIRGA